MRRYSVIYEVLDDLRRVMEGALKPEFLEEITGHVEIRRLFKSSKIGLIAGCIVLDGTIKRNSKCRLIRDGSVVYTGSIGSLRREKDEANEVRSGFECGIVLRDFRDIRVDDVVEAYRMKEIKRTLLSIHRHGEPTNRGSTGSADPAPSGALPPVRAGRPALVVHHDPADRAEQ